MMTISKHFLPFLLFTLITSCGQELIFSGTADKKYDGNKIILYKGETQYQDSAIIKDGKFTIKTRFERPTLYMLYSDLEMKIKHNYAPTTIVITEPGTVNIAANPENLVQSTISGAKEDSLYKAFFLQNATELQKTIDDLNNKYGKEFVNNPNPDTGDPRYKNFVAEYQQLNAANGEAEIQRLEMFIKSNPSSFAAVLLLEKYADNLEAAQLENLYALIPPKYKDSDRSKKIAAKLDQKRITAVGQIAPDFIQPDTAGNPVKLSDFRGKYVLVDFWASWCGPCRMENPNVVNAFNMFRDKGFTVLGVSLDQPGKKADWLTAIHKDKLAWSQVSDLKFWQNEAAVLYGIKGIPANLLIDKNGRIVAKNLRGEELIKKLIELLGS